MADTPHYRRRVWDPVVRVLHWWMAITLLVQIALAIMIMSEDALGMSEAGEHTLVDVHATFGTLFAIGLLARLVWLFAAPGSGSWRDLLPVTAAQRQTLSATLRHYFGGFRGEGPLYWAHNPLAGLIYAAFFVVAVVQVVTGGSMFLLGDDELGEAWMELHELGFWLIVIYVVAHVVMVAIHELTEGRGLISAMVNGHKLFRADDLERGPGAANEEDSH
ncbi:MAG TPA: cytochrome b/b6 domain-containing protein [Gammaproteobacteria bacterium]|nr:cytochrome b/b6 domain-containing protein [Gammaproteobacteria bacterium]